MKETQRQRRFLIPTEAHDEWRGLMARFVASHIDDGYFEMPGGRVMRVRVEFGPDIPERAFLTCKSGRGASRELEHFPLQSADDGERLLAQCLYRTEKLRYLLVDYPGRGADAWHIDEYLSSLEGLMILETGANLAITPSGQSVEVTETLTGLHFAKLAHELSQRAGEHPADEAMRMVARLPRIVLTGGPCSGKSTAMETLKKKFGAQLHCVPEVATIVIGQVGVKPWTGGARNMLAAQRLMYRTQRAFEDASDSQARTDGRSAMLLDRGVGDIGAYLPGGISDIEHLVHTTIAHEFARYDLVIVLDLPSETVYEANRANNPARTETYEKAQALANGIRRAWSTHPNFRFVADTALWHEKEATVVSLVETFLRTPRP